MSEHINSEENEGRLEQSSKKDVEQLEMLAFHLTQVCKRLSGDHEHWVESGKDLSKAVNNLNQTLQRFTELEKKVAEQVAVVISEGSYNAARIITEVTGEKTKEVLLEQISTVADHLSKVIREATGTLTDYKWQVSSLKKWFLIGVSLSSLLGNLVAGIVVYQFLGNMQDRNAVEIIREIRANKTVERGEKVPVSTPKNKNYK